MPSGTSVRGFQTLFTAIPNQDTFIRLNVAGADDFRPMRVGFLYLFSYVLSDLSEQAVLDSKIVYAPGVLLRTSGGGGNNILRKAVVVNWNLPGLEWGIESIA